MSERRRSSMVPSMAEIRIDTRNPAPQSNQHSLDFDRIVNAYSVMSVKKRLVQHYNRNHHRGNARGRRKSRQMKELIKSYRTFKDERNKDKGDDQGDDSLLHTPSGKAYARWFLTISLGIFCGAVAVFLVFCTSHIIDFRTQRLNWQLQWASGTANVEEYVERFGVSSTPDFSTPKFSGVQWAATYGAPAVLLEYIVYNAILACMSALLCIWFAPNAVGSGIPEVKAYLNGVNVEYFADLNVFITKIVGTIFAVSSGLIVGPEGPLVHIGAIVGQGITKTTKLEVDLRKLQMHWPKTSAVLGCGKIPDDAFTDEKALEETFDQYFQPGVTDDILEEEDEEDDEDDTLISLRVNELEGARTNYGSSYQQQRHGSATTNGQHAQEQRCKPKENTFFTTAMGILARFRNDGDRRDLISIGVATGFASAFGAPVGGLLYSFEEASSFFTIPLMWRTLVATALGTFVIAVYHGDLSDFSVLSLGTGPADEQPKHALNTFLEVPFYVLVGAMGGLLGAFFNGCYLYFNTIRQKRYERLSNRKKNISRLLEVLAVSILTSLVTFCLPVYLPDSWACSDVSKLSEEKAMEAAFDSRYNCPEGQFNEIASIMLGSRDEALNDILTDPSQFEARTLLLCGLAFLFLMVITFGIFIPSGLFMPTLLTGSTISGWAGLLIQRHFLPSLVPEHLALVGATAMLAGVQRTTVSLCVIMMEATGQTKVLIPLIIGVIVARYVGDVFNEGFYHINIHLKHYPFLEHEIKESFDICTVSDIMSSPVITLKAVEQAQYIEKLLLTTNYAGFPVLDQETGQYAGLIRRDQLVALLECGFFLESLEEEVHTSGRESIRVKALMSRAESEHLNRALVSDADTYTADRKTAKLLETEHEWLNDNIFRADLSGSVIVTAETLPGHNAIAPSRGAIVDFDDSGKIIVKVMGEEKNYHIDIAAAMNRGAYTVTQNCPLSKAYSLFTQMGLRHLPVLGKDGTVAGIVTRSNLNPSYMEKRTGLDMHN